jgi:lysophospholipase L1-like esterase
VTPGATPPPALRRVAGAAALLGASLLVAALLAEGTLRILAASGNALAGRIAAFDPYSIKVEPHGAFGYRQRPGAVLTYANGTRATANREGFRGPEVAIPKPAGVYRIILLGESSTHGWYVNDDQTIDTYLRARLAAIRPGLRVEVVNLAYDGYDAYQMWQRLRDDGVRLQPDLLLVNAGVNDVRNAKYPDLRGDPDPRTLIWEADLRRLRQQQAAGGPTLWTRLKHVSYLARLPGVARGWWRPRGQGRPVEPGPYPDAADNFQRNVERIAGIARELRVPLLLSTPPSALLLSDAPPAMQARDYWIGDAATTQRYRDTLAARLGALATQLSTAGQPVARLAPRLPSRMFLDDVHLTADGNRAIATAFAEAVTRYLPRAASHPGTAPGR